MIHNRREFKNQIDVLLAKIDLYNGCSKNVELLKHIKLQVQTKVNSYGVGSTTFSNFYNAVRPILNLRVTLDPQEPMLNMIYLKIEQGLREQNKLELEKEGYEFIYTRSSPYSPSVPTGIKKIVKDTTQISKPLAPQLEEVSKKQLKVVKEALPDFTSIQPGDIKFHFFKDLSKPFTQQLQELSKEQQEVAPVDHTNSIQ